jgi:hypothetical protein
LRIRTRPSPPRFDSPLESSRSRSQAQTGAQQLGLSLLASQARKNRPLADRATVVDVWRKLDQFKRPSPS